MQIPKIQETEETEVWKIFKDTRGISWRGALWEVSNFGHIKKDDKNFQPKLGNGGYYTFSGWDLHVVVAWLFVPNPLSKPTVDHIDRNSKNNHYKNLRWATWEEQAENKTKWLAKHKSQA